MRHILDWTGGHPYLTQQLCRAATEAGSQTEAAIDTLCQQLFLDIEALQRDANLAFVHNSLLRSSVDVGDLLDLYQQVSSGNRVVYEETNPLCPVLRLAGVVTVQEGLFCPRNRIYEQVFDTAWIQRHRPHRQSQTANGVMEKQRLDTALVTPPNNLPTPLTSFVGREAQKAEIKALLGTSRLLTFLGFGGFGKTRLSQEVARETLPQYPDGVWFIDLAPITDPGLVAQTVASVLGIKEEAQTPLVQTLLQALRSQHLLLLLDNCEHLLTACASLARSVLHACPGVQIVATSREGLSIAGEVLYRVSSLSLPPPAQSLSVESIAQYEAPRLFAERAQRHQPSFKVTEQNMEALVSICRRLDGIPLAIELAAARIKVLTVEEINSRLDNRFRLLTGGDCTALPRQQTLRALIDWSYDLLNAQEKTLLQRLSVFAGDCTLDAAEYVCADERLEVWEILDLLTSLVDKSLVVTNEIEGTTRYRMLETIRQYAQDRLLDAGEGQRQQGVMEARTYSEVYALRSRHCEFFLRLTAKANPELSGPKQMQWLDKLEQEHSNLLAALQWCVVTKDCAIQGLQMAILLNPFWDLRGYYREGRDILTALLKFASLEEPIPEQAEALYCAGTLAWWQSDFIFAQSYFEQCLAIARVLQNQKGMANALSGLGDVAYARGDYDLARTLQTQNLTLCREQQDEQQAGIALLALGNIAHQQNDNNAAEQCYRQCLDIFKKLGNSRYCAMAVSNLGNIAFNSEKYVEAQGYYEEGLRIQHQLGDKLRIAASLFNIANSALRLHDYDTASSLLTQSLNMFCKLGNKLYIICALQAFGILAKGRKQFVRCVRLFAAAEALGEAILAPVHMYTEEYADEMRSELGEEAFAVARTVGRLMTAEEASLYALEA